MCAAGQAACHLQRRRDAVGGHEPKLTRRRRVAAARDEHRSEPVERRPARIPVGEGQHGVAGAPAAIVVDRARVGDGRALGLGKRRLLASRPGRLEEGAVRLLRRMGEPSPKGRDEDGGAALPHRERVAPEPERIAEAQRGSGERVRPLPGEEQRRPRDADEDRVEGLGERRRFRSTLRTSASAWATEGGPAKTADAVSSSDSEPRTRARSGAGTSPNALASHEPVTRSTASGSYGYPRSEPESRGTSSVSETPSTGTRLPIARSSATARSHPGAPWVSSSESAVSPRAASAEAAERKDAGPPFSTVSAAPTVTTASVSTSARFTGVPSPGVHQSWVLGVVHRHLAAEPQREVGCDEALDHPPPGPPGEPGRDEQGLALGRDADSLELVRGRGDRRLARVARGAGDRERGRLDEDRRAAAARDDRLERLTGQRKPQRVADGGADVGDRLPRRRGRRDRDGVLAAVHDDEPRAVEDREAWH